jgi:hypothetical protein
MIKIPETVYPQITLISQSQYIRINLREAWVDIHPRPIISRLVALLDRRFGQF